MLINSYSQNAIDVQLPCHPPLNGSPVIKLIAPKKIQAMMRINQMERYNVALNACFLLNRAFFNETPIC
jgi:hypothetical protein